jgi:hypothetical protein
LGAFVPIFERIQSARKNYRQGGEPHSASMANNAGISVDFEPSFNLRQADESFGTV